MKIWVLSDLHNEVGRYKLSEIPEADVCIAAGDIDRGARESVDWLAAHVRPSMPVVAVLGNHEFYGHTIEREISEAGYWGRQRDVQMLDDSVTVIDGVRFIGATLWTSFDLYSDGQEHHRDRYMKAARTGMNDYRMIATKDGRFTPEMSRELHLASVAFLDEALAVPFAGDTVVVSHHCPSIRSVHEVHEGDPVTPAFSSDLDWLIEKHQPALWVHGHTHSSFDYEIGATRVVCNPRGYHRWVENQDENKGFDPAMVVEIGGYQPTPPGM
ncbi:MAG: metallophosphoesterase [Alphaproteobacteria bacterium]|uniref:Putative calcineurin-like phosphoesterase n=1 Tax=viral metagenome TaxID=1070528 RepID=A0A6M3XZN2_9ZZZZ|nr:metallophosphoesterase [Alphaproteobacteria bacterium]MBU1561518.1 metallophosphoesterase [Alphaproteobacteria bacterium]MBU2300959.1 metallophosphoesterase [Alphaproteobacteria bacterium]MBU2368410.1 metallophosphoesterase [Alphaproteobacteria bacterium]